MRATGRIMTLRGLLSKDRNNKKQLVVGEGRLNVGYIIESFTLWPTEYDANYAFYGYLATDVRGITNMDASKSDQIAWFHGGFYAPAPSAIIDPQHIVNQDLYVVTNDSDIAIALNYLITMREVHLSDDEAIMTILKSEAQNVQLP